MATGRRLRVLAKTGVAPSAYGANMYLQLSAVDAPRTLATERLLAAATFRAAALVEDLLMEQSTCAVCVDEHEGRIHLEFADRATAAEENVAREVLEEVAEGINEA